MKPITSEQLKAIHAVIYRKGLLRHKAEIIESFSGGRTSTSKELTCEEARALLMSMNDYEDDKKDCGPMIRKLFAMAHQMGWIKKKQHVGAGGEITEVNDNQAVYDWVTKYGYLRKDLRKYTYNELPKLISSFEKNLYNPYIETLSKRKG